MRTHTKSEYVYENRLSYLDRKEIAILYLEGFAIYNIANAFSVTPSTVQWHLKKLDVYQKNKLPTRLHIPISRNIIYHEKNLTLLAIRRTHITFTWAELNTKQDYEDARYEQSKPSTYEEIKKKQQTIQSTHPRNDYADIPSKYDPKEFKVMYSIEL